MLMYGWARNHNFLHLKTWHTKLFLLGVDKTPTFLGPYYINVGQIIEMPSQMSKNLKYSKKFEIVKIFGIHPNTYNKLTIMSRLKNRHT